MIQDFVDRFIARQKTLFVDSHPGSYSEIVEKVIRAINPDGEYGLPDPDRIHEINDGDYQGTLVYVIAGTGYQPHEYWSVMISYGSCSGCDTLYSIHEYGDDSPTEGQTADYQTLALHVVQGLHLMDEVGV